MPIQDQAGNALVVPTTVQMLGFEEPVAADEVLNLNIYDFIIRPIRDADVTQGHLFLKRFLAGPQAMWRQTQSDIFRLKDLWDIFRIDDEHLQYMKDIVGWVKDTKHITDKLTPTQLRKVIASSMPLWKRRGTEEAYKQLIGMIYATRIRCWNWFDLRWILDESVIGENHDGRDISILDSVGQRESNLRVMLLDGMDRELVGDFVRLLRPSGERVLVTYLHFLDQFDQGNLAWSEDASTPITVDDETFTLQSNLPDALDFSAGSDRADWMVNQDVTSQPRTIVLRARFNVIGAGNQRLVTINNAGLDLEACYLQINNSNEVEYAELYNATSRTRGSTATVGATNWHWIAIVADGTANATGIRIFIDGVETGGYAGPSNGTGGAFDIDGRVTLGGRSEDNVMNMDGLIADVRIWNAALTDDELMAEFRSTNAPVRTEDLYFNPDLDTLIDPISGVTGTLNAGAAQVADQAVSHEVFLPDVDATEWTDFIAYARVRGSQQSVNGRFGMVVYGQDTDNHIRVGINVASNNIRLEEWVGGVQNSLVTGAIPFLIDEDIWLGLRVQVLNGQIDVWLENAHVLTYNGALALDHGAPGVFHSLFGVVECSELEQFPLPAVDEYIDINS